VRIQTNRGTGLGTTGVKMRIFLVPAMALALCACASTAPVANAPGVENAVYVVGEGMPQPQAVAASDTQQPADGTQQPSKLLKLYLYFAGR